MSLEDDVEYLSRYIETPTELASPKIERVMNRLRESDEHEHERLRRILHRSRKPSQLIPKTVGSFLFGCLQSNYGEVDKTSSPFCVNSLLSPHEPGIVYVYNQERH